MKCTNPIFIKNVGARFTIIGNKCFEGVYVPCGQCIACRLNYAKMWSIRMMD